MKCKDIFKLLMRDTTDNFVLKNKDGFILISLIRHEGQLKHFKITINYEPGKILFQKQMK